jgi:hypothetical protein
LIAAGGIEPVIAHDKVFILLSLTQRFVHYGRWLFHHRLNAGAMKVLSRQTTPKPSSSDPACTYYLFRWRTRATCGP